VENLLRWLHSERVKKMIVAGDFNTFPYSKAVRRMNKALDDSLWQSLDYLSATYPKIAFPIKPRIDYIFHSSGLACQSARVIKDSAGDHYPVLAVFDVESDNKQ
jgi:endonuclease/exonuclease/phosphatase (EEP) superfamily protein YafD